MLQQSLQAERVVICYTQPTDIAGIPADTPGVIFSQARPGLPHQRNVILEQVQDLDLLVFFDDDFLAAPSYLQTVSEAFAARPDIVAATGRPIADGARGPGIAEADALRMIAADPPQDAAALEPAPHGYGCNMALRIATTQEHGLKFDERLPLYGWSEDVDFTHRIGRHGGIVKLLGARGVHLGTKKGRSSGRRLGYSQVANPLYLRGKGSYSWGRAVRSVGRNLAANSLGAMWSEPYIDRRGRLLGNGLAFIDLLRGRLAPERVLEF